MIRSRLRSAALAILLAATAGCSFAPAYHRPALTLPPDWRTVAGWQPAQPSDAAPRGDWWTLFGDPTLKALVAEADAHNQTLAQAAATYEQARAVVREARAGLFPTVTADGSVTHTHSGSGRTIVTGGVISGGTGTGTGTGTGAGTGTSTGTTTSGVVTGGGSGSTSYRVNIGASWEPDFFGQVRNDIANARLTAEARLADIANTRLAIHGELVTDYLSLRATDAELILFQQTVAGYQRSLTIATNRYNAGVVARTDVFQAQSQLASAQSDLVGLERTRAQYVDSIAVLVGQPAPAFRLAAAAWNPVVPPVPVAVPSTLLQRRPDIAAAERAVAAANAEIGVARAAFFPSISLSASTGFENDALAGLFSAASSLWSLGGSVAETLLDFGARSARVSQARAAYHAAVASYRGTVLTAMQDVQDALVAQGVLARQEALLRTASQAADRSEQSERNQYLAGLVVFSDVVTAQATALTARRALLQAELDRQTAAVALIQALGGGWTSTELANGTPAATQSGTAP